MDNIIRFGNKVRIADSGQTYTTDTGWVIKNAPDLTSVAQYAFGDSLDYAKSGSKSAYQRMFKVLAVADERAYVRAVDDHRCYVVKISALEKIKE